MFYRGVTKFTTVSPHYLLNPKPHKQHILKSQLSQYFITQQKNEYVCEISEQFFS